MRMLRIRVLLVIVFVPVILWAIAGTIWNEIKHIPFHIKCDIINKLRSIKTWWVYGRSKK